MRGGKLERLPGWTRDPVEFFHGIFCSGVLGGRRNKARDREHRPMRPRSFTRSRSWRQLDWQSILLLLLASCVIGFDVLGRVSPGQRSLGKATNPSGENVRQGWRITRPPTQALPSPEEFYSHRAAGDERSLSDDIDKIFESFPPPGYTVTRVVPEH